MKVCRSLRANGYNIFFLLLVLFLTASVSYAQMTKEEVFTVLSLEEYSGTNNAKEIDVIYERYLNLVSYKPNELLEGLGYSALSGIGLGSVESSEYGYQKSGWLPVFLKDWYNNSPRGDGAPMYQLFGWQEVWREVDYASDRAAYESLKLFFGGKWYYAMLVHWVIKNTFATIVRDKFKYDQYLYSFKFDLLFSLSK
jgi:hypothetical protein